MKCPIPNCYYDGPLEPYGTAFSRCPNCKSVFVPKGHDETGATAEPEAATPTPRTDATFIYEMHGVATPLVSIDFARTLERELAEANAKTHEMFKTAVKTEQELKSVIADLKAANATADATIETLQRDLADSKDHRALRDRLRATEHGLAKANATIETLTKELKSKNE